MRVSEFDIMAVAKHLVDTAIRYTPQGDRVDLSVNLANGSAVLRIQVTGQGIPLAEWHRVLDPFYRTHGSEQIGSGCAPGGRARWPSTRLRVPEGSTT